MDAPVRWVVGLQGEPGSEHGQLAPRPGESDGTGVPTDAGCPQDLAAFGSAGEG